MGDAPAPSANETTDAQIKALINNFPALREVMNTQMPIDEQVTVDTQRTIAPQVAQIQTDLLNMFGPGLAEAGAAVDTAGALGRASGEAEVLAGPGRDLAAGTRELMGILDPEFMSVREGIASGFDDLDLQTGLTGAESEQISRGLNRTAAGRGNLDLPTNTGAIEAATNFGDRLTQKKMAIAQALQGFGGILPTLRTGIDPAQLALGRSSTGSQLAAASFPGISQPNFGARTEASGSQLLSETGQNARQSNQINSERRTGLDVGLGAFGGIAKGIGSIASAFRPQS